MTAACHEPPEKYAYVTLLKANLSQHGSCFWLVKICNTLPSWILFSSKHITQLRKIPQLIKLFWGNALPAWREYTDRKVSPFYRPRRPLGRVEVYVYSVLDLGTRRGWGVSVTPRSLSTPGGDPVPIVQEAGWAPGPVWTGAENLAPPGFFFRSPDHPARSQSLYRLSYPAHVFR
jgi:hypothetical protein